MAKRKRNESTETTFTTKANGNSSTEKIKSSSKKIKATDVSKPTCELSPATIQIVAGSYDRVLHGITATLCPGDKVEFADTFLFNAHVSAIRCLALSPPSAPAPGKTQKVILATGSTDERVNLYHLSAHLPRKSPKPSIPSLTSRPVLENPQNKELGSLLHHSSSITALYFPNRSKLLSSAEDCTIAVTRTRDWSHLSTIKAPIPKTQGRPSGDTAAPGEVPAGINDFAVHPSLKLMISVGKGEKCMRLWNLVTGKKAGVLNFGRDTLGEVGEGKYASGEGRRVVWGCTDAGEEFCVGFERGAVVFGMDSRPRCKIVPEPKTKLHQLRYVPLSTSGESAVLALSTEDGRILFYDTNVHGCVAGEGHDTSILSARLVAQLGGKAAGLSGRIKDFKVLCTDDKADSRLIVGAGSDGCIRLWALDMSVLNGHKPGQAGRLLADYETGHRITCLDAFVILAEAEGDGAHEDGGEDGDGDEDED